MSPEWRRSVSFGLEEENRRDTVHPLNEVFTNEEPADSKRWTGAYPFLDVGLVCVI